jgi:hypothetical protein
VSEAEEIISDDDLSDGDLNPVSTSLVKEVAGWKLEAKNEDNERYFFHVREVENIESGDKCYVIGRKGSGKTAISEYFANIASSETFAEKLTFKNFPFNDLYNLKNDGYTRPNQYITLWKFLIYSSICKMMGANQNINSEIRLKLEKLYGSDHTTLSRKLSKWVGKEFSIGLLGISVKVSRESSQHDDVNWIERVDILEDIILQYADSARYYIVFDELDEDYRDIIKEKKYDQYTALVTSLFKAVQDIKGVFKDRSRYKIFPVVFLRDDIYEIIKDSDKNKWNDFKIELNWDVEKIKRLIAFRITRALDSTCEKILPFEAAWEILLGRDLMRIGAGQRRRVSSFEFIARSTYLRPRDFVKYLQACAEEAVQTDGKINREIIKKVDKAFSNYLKDELVDELFAILPDISAIFDVISQLRKWIFRINEFERAYREERARGDIGQADFGFVLQILFLFSVVGNTPRSKFFVFRYTNKEVRLNFRENLVVHRGLFKALQII